MRAALRSLLRLSFLLAAGAAETAETRVRLLVQSAPLAGLRYYEASAVWPQLRPGDEVLLQREPLNPHDRDAVQVRWRGHLLGYVPKRSNATLSWALDRGDPLRARISRLAERRGQRVEIEVYIE